MGLRHWAISLRLVNFKCYHIYTLKPTHFFTDEAKEIFAKYDVVGPIANALNRHSGNSYICAYGAWALLSLTANGKNKQTKKWAHFKPLPFFFFLEKLQEEVGKSGALRTVIEAVNSYVGNSILCRKGSGVIWNALISCGPECIRGSHVVEGLSKALKVYANDSFTCYSVCGALTNVILTDCKQ